MHSLTCMSVVECIVRKLRPCNSHSRRRDRINSVLWRSYYKRGGGTTVPRGAVGDHHLVTVTQGVAGDRLPWGWGRTRGGEGTSNDRCDWCAHCPKQIVTTCA